MRIERIKEGMTNDSHILVLEGKQFVVRLPGKGTETLINRTHEAQVYQVIAPLNIADKVLFIDPANGYKITQFLTNATTCDKYNWEQVKRCMDKLKVLHQAKLQVDFSFDPFERILFYEGLMEVSGYPDYQQTRDNVFALQIYLSPVTQVLCHLDANPDNFLFYGEDQQKLKLIDWEYAAMQDPLMDLAMWAIYAMYDRQAVDQLMDCYSVDTQQQRYRVYAYMAICGLTWSNWCEYKARLGVHLGAYATAQYTYAKTYYQLFMTEWGQHV